MAPAAAIEDEMESERDYYARRAEQERRAAALATNAAAARVHAELARLYAALTWPGRDAWDVPHGAPKGAPHQIDRV